LTAPGGVPVAYRRANCPAQPFRKRPALAGKTIDSAAKDIPGLDSTFYICREGNAGSRPASRWTFARKHCKSADHRANSIFWSDLPHAESTVDHQDWRAQSSCKTLCASHRNRQSGRWMIVWSDKTLRDSLLDAPKALSHSVTRW